MLASLSLLGLLAMGCGLVGLFLTGHLFSTSPWVIAPQLAAVALMIWSRLTFGVRSFHASATPTSGGIVSSGPYRFIRHPIYTARCLFALAGAAGHPTTGGWLLWATVLVGALMRMLPEEDLLRKRYPEYVEYARRTRRMIPYLF